MQRFANGDILRLQRRLRGARDGLVVNLGSSVIFRRRGGPQPSTFVVAAVLIGFCHGRWANRQPLNSGSVNSTDTNASTTTTVTLSEATSASVAANNDCAAETTVPDGSRSRIAVS